jgi:hypothetical protein
VQAPLLHHHPERHIPSGISISRLPTTSTRPRGESPERGHDVPKLAAPTTLTTPAPVAVVAVAVITLAGAGAGAGAGDAMSGHQPETTACPPAAATAVRVPSALKDEARVATARCVLPNAGAARPKILAIDTNNDATAAVAPRHQATANCRKTARQSHGRN